MPKVVAMLIKNSLSRRGGHRTDQRWHCHGHRERDTRASALDSKHFTNFIFSSSNCQEFICGWCIVLLNIHSLTIWQLGLQFAMTLHAMSSCIFWKSAVRLSFSFQADRVRESLSWLDNLITCRDESPVSAEAGCVSQCTAAGWRRPPAGCFSGIIVCDWWLRWWRRHHRHCTEGQPSPAQPSYRLQLYLTLTTRHMQGDTSWGYPVPFIPFSLI